MFGTFQRFKCELWADKNTNKPWSGRLAYHSHGVKETAWTECKTRQDVCFLWTDKGTTNVKRRAGGGSRHGDTWWIKMIHGICLMFSWEIHTQIIQHNSNTTIWCIAREATPNQLHSLLMHRSSVNFNTNRIYRKSFLLVAFCFRFGKYWKMYQCRLNWAISHWMESQWALKW